MPLGANATWDFTSVPFDVPAYNLITTTNQNPLVFTSAQSSINTEYNFYNYPVPCVEFYNKDNTGHYLQGFTLDSMFYPFDDKWETFFIIPNQTVFNDPPLQLCKLPLLYNEGHIDSSSSVRSIKALTNRPQFNLNNVKLDMQMKISSKFKSVGYGKINLPYYPQNLEVLLFYVEAVYASDLFINGSLAPKNIADSIHLASGVSDTVSSYYFYAKGYPGEILSINRTMTLDYGYYYWSYILKKSTTTDVIESFSSSNMKVSPLPSNNGIINISFPNNSTNPCKLIVCDAYGKNIYSTTINTANGEISHKIDLSDQPSGLYFIKLFADSGSLLYSDKAIIYK
jgi:hypothetical protein